MRPTILAAVAAFVLTGTALAAPSDYEDRLPAALLDMELVQSELPEDALVAFYGGAVGRATLTVFPTVEADPRGTAGPEAQGATPSAQRALMQATARNLEVGTNALGEGYENEHVRQIAVTVESVELTCATIERRSARSTENELEGLLDRICVTQNGPDSLSVYVTTPYRGERMREGVWDAQLNFIGNLVVRLVAGN